LAEIPAFDLATRENPAVPIPLPPAARDGPSRGEFRQGLSRLPAAGIGSPGHCAFLIVLGSVYTTNADTFAVNGQAVSVIDPD